MGILFATWLTARILGSVFSRMLKRSPPLIFAHLKRLTWLFVWSLGVLFASQQLGIRVDVLLLLVALFGSAIIIANVETLQNVAAKYFSDVYVPFKLGDSIRVRDFAGKVIEINPISTVLMTDKEELVAIPNSFFLKEIVVNTSQHAWKEIIIPAVIDVNLDIAEFEREVTRRCNKFKLQLDERYPPSLTVRRRDEKSLELALTLMVKRPEKKDEIVSEVNRNIVEILGTLKKKGS